MGKVDDTALRALAKKHGLTGTYRVWSEGERAYAWARAFKDGKHAANVGSNRLDTEQAVFDFVVDLVRRELERKPMRGSNVK